MENDEAINLRDETFEAILSDFIIILETLSGGYEWRKFRRTSQASLMMVAMELSKIINSGLQENSLLEIQRYIELLLKDSSKSTKIVKEFK